MTSNEQSPRGATEVKRLDALRALDIIGTPPEAHFAAVCSLARTFFNVPTVLISLIEEDYQWFKARCGFEPDRTPRAISFCDHVIRSDAILVVEDATRDPRFAANPLVTGDPRIRFYAGAPLALSPGIRIGTICIIDVVPRRFTADDCRKLDEFAAIVVALLRLDQANIQKAKALSDGAARETFMKAQAQELECRDTELRETNRLLLLAEEMANAGHWRLDVPTRSRVWSPEVYRIFGVDPASRAPDLNDEFEAYHPEDRDHIRTKVHAAITDGAPFTLEVRVCRRDGSTRHAELRGVCEFGADGAVRCVFGVIIDVTDRLRAETARREAEERLQASTSLYQTLSESLPQMVWVVRADDRTALYGNQRYHSYYGPIGTSRDERISRNHPDDVDHMEATWRQAAAEGRTFETEGRLRQHDGIYRWHKLIATPIYRDGKIIEWLGTALDVDDIIMGRQKLKETSDLLSLSQDAAGAGFFDLDLLTGAVLLSGQSVPMHGLGSGDAIDIDWDRWRACVDPDDAARVLKLVEEACAERKTYSGEFRVLDDGKPVRWIHGIGRAHYDRAGRAVRMIGLNFDITERKAAEAKLMDAIAAAETARREAEQASAAKSDFLASMSHEIRTPLNSIVGYTDLLLDEGRHERNDRQKLELIRDSGQALLTIVNDILDFSKIEAGEIDLDPIAFSLSVLIDNVLSMVSGFEGARRLKIERDLASDIPDFLYGDAGRLRQILLNLLNNAVKFTAEGTVKLVVFREQSTPGFCRLRFIVTDTGIGIPCDRRERLFQRFSQVDGSIARRFGGTGLGLAISKSLVERMGGDIGVASTEGLGSSFWFTITLPIFVTAAQAVEPAASHAPSGVPARILLAEDVLVNQDLARLILQAGGHSVEVASDGAQAIRLVQQETFDLVLMDVQMPGMDGMTATRHIRALDLPCRSIPIVAMTANVLPQQIATFQAAGMDDHLGKPFKRAELYAVVARWTKRTADVAVKNPPTRSGLDRGVLEELRGIVGDAVIEALVGKFAVEVDQRLTYVHGPIERERLAADAHALISSAGSLGFTAFSDTCREVESKARRGDDLAACIAVLQDARGLVLNEVASLLS